MKVTGWTWWGNPDYIGMDEPHDKEWCEWIRANDKEVDDAVISALKENGYIFTGDMHQNCDTGCPIIDGKYLAEYSERCWGDIIARAYPDTIPDRCRGEYAYVVWAWIVPEGYETNMSPMGD